MFMVMTYDYHGGWTGPGEVAPTSQVKQCLKYAARTIPIEKLYMGIPRYGYDWNLDYEEPNWGYGYSYFQTKYETFGGNLTRTEDGHELKLEYVDEFGYYHIAYYCDADTTLHKEALFSQYPMGGYCYWHLSSGDPNYFTALELFLFW